MKIKDYFKKFFEKNKKDNSALARFSDIVPMPKRDDFLNQKTMLDLIDKYKANYEEVLLIPKYYIGESLYANNLYEEMKMNLDLVVFNFFIDEENVAKSQISTLILREKLKLYYDAILTMKYETDARIIALNEILKEKKFIAKFKRNIIANEINRLYITLILFASQRQALLTKIEVCLNNVLVKETKDLISKNGEQENKQLIEDKLIALKKSTLEEYRKVLPNFYPIREDKDKILKDLAFIERELEIYTSKNKDKIISYLDEIGRIASTSLNVNNKEELLKKLEDIELNFLVFRAYGKNLITEDYLETLYRIKFQVLTYSPNGICESLANYKMHDSELEYYKKIISTKISFFRSDIYFFSSGNDVNLNDFFEEDRLCAIKVISQIIKTNNIYDPEEILKDKLKLNLTLALNDKEGLKNFYLNFPFSKDDIEKICPDLYRIVNEGSWKNLFRINEKPSIELWLWLYHLEKQNLGLNLFTLLKKHIDLGEEKNKYYFPEGIEHISLDLFGGGDVLFNLRKEMEGKIVILPKSLVSLDTCLFRNVSLEGLYLNEGLEYLMDRSIKCKSLKTLVISSTLENFSSLIIDEGEIETCIFNDFTNSKILNNPMLLKEFLENFVYLKKIECHEYLARKPQHTESKIYSELISNEYYNNEVIGKVFDIRLKMNKIILVDGDNIYNIATDYFTIPTSYGNNESEEYYKEQTLGPMPLDIDMMAQRMIKEVLKYKNNNKLVRK